MKKLFTVILAFSLAFALSASAFAASFTIDFGWGFTLIIESDTKAGLAKQAFEAINKIRADSGLEPIIWDDGLAQPAIQRAAEASISSDDYNSAHMRPNGESWITAALDAKAENLVYGALTTPRSAIDECMDIEEYGNNILNPEFTSIAVGCVEISPDEFYWVLLFGDKVNPDPPNYYIVTFDDACGSGISGQMIPEGGKIIKPLDPLNPGYIAGGWFKDIALTEQWDFDTDTADNDITLYLNWVYIGYDNSDSGSADGNGDNGFHNGGGNSNSGIRTSGGSVSSGGGGSGGGGGGGVFSAGNTDAAVNTPQTVNTVHAVGAVIAALNAAKTSGSSTASVRFINPGMISLETLQAMNREAGSTALTVYADSMCEDGKSVDVRLSFNIANAAKAIDLSASTTSGRANSIKTLLEKWFNNTVSVVNCTHQGDFGMNVEVASKLDPKINKDSLIFYAYDFAANKYSQIVPALQYRLDSNGYVHFNTVSGGDIIISDKPLMLK